MPIEGLQIFELEEVSGGDQWSTLMNLINGNPPPPPPPPPPAFPAEQML